MYKNKQGEKIYRPKSNMVHGCEVKTETLSLKSSPLLKLDSMTENRT